MLSVFPIAVMRAFFIALIASIITVVCLKRDTTDRVVTLPRSTQFATAFFWWFIGSFLAIMAILSEP